MRTLALVALALLALGSRVGAEELAVGSTLPALSLQDQWGRSHALGPGTRFVLFSRDMAGGGVLQEALAEDGAALLEAARAVYVADVSGMPGIIRSVIAKPRMRRRGYPVLLDESGDATAGFPHVEGRATLLALDGLRIERVEHFDSAAALRAALAP